MKNRFGSQKGVTLTILVITVVVLLILTSVIIYNAKKDLELKNLKEMQVDINTLREKIIEYYNKYGEIPILVKDDKKRVEYKNIDNLEKSGILSSATDTGKFYVIDLSALENLSLNNGKDYEVIKNNNNVDVNILEDLYIINESSNNIFYVRGVRRKEKIYYTDYSPEEKEKEKVPIKVLMPGERVEDKNKIYSKNGVAIIPKGFTVSKIPEEQDVDKGLVIYDIPESDFNKLDWEEDLNNNNIPDVQEKYNQFVWIPVNDINDFKRTEGYGNKDNTDNSGKLQGVLAHCNEMDKNGNNAHIGEEQILKDETKAMYQSVANNKGFYIGRYETGTSQKRNFVTDLGNGVTITKNKHPYNYIKWLEKNGAGQHIGGALKISRELYNSPEYGAKSTLCYGVQWDAILNYINPKYITNETGNSKPNCEIYSFIVDSRAKGNHSKNIQMTGSNEKYSMKNIYDMSGNVWEWTMETYDLGSVKTRVIRGGGFLEDGFKTPVSNRSNFSPDNGKDYIGFRVALFLQ